MSNNLYTEDSIESLSPLEFTRLRPQVYCGSTTYATQLLIEIISNSVDEFRAGHGDKIEVVICEDGEIRVRDYGQGFIVNSFRDDGKTILEAAFSVLNTSGKYREDGTYEGTSLGSFGIGAKLAVFLSNWLNVVTFRDGQMEEIMFREGVFESRKVAKNNQPSGTYVCWKPSAEFFTYPIVELDKIKSLFKTISCLCPGLTIELYIKGPSPETHVFKSKNGLNDLVDEAVGDKEIINRRFSMEHLDGKSRLDMILTYTSNYSSTIVPYVNTGLTERGPHITQIKTVITREFNKFFKEKKWLKDKEAGLSGDDIQEGLYVVFNITAQNVAYDAQVKTTVTKIEISNLMSTLADSLQQWLEANEKQIKAIFDKAQSALKAREAAKKARDAVRGTKPNKESGLKAKMALSSKFTDCTSKKVSERNLLLVEGTSAAAAAIEARNPRTDCIYELRGKTISPLKTTVEKLVSNQEISDIIRIIGAGFGSAFDLAKMTVDKIVITSDQDSDGRN